ncbi:MAG: 3'-5' exonuclease [Bacteroidales bacterium]|jgi:DNA polymerase-3 subunit epsilon|nr:3'-5' exonuclease [Bacteroidales bacterium]MDY0313459.1 3'-5' exonuclease [Bacteroidales bacterium]NLB86127.1 3'-5' exonuclease [Bacteroidales bacterium]
MNIKIKKPIVFFDLETTGINPSTDRIVEISILKVFPNGNETIKTYRINPEIDIPSESSAIHGITNEDVKDSPTFKMLVKEIINLIDDADLAGYNSNKFDIPLLAEELLRAGSNFDLKKRNFIDVMVIFMKKEPRNLEAAYKFYCNKELENAHSAEADIKATYEVFKAQTHYYDDLDTDIESISKYSSQNNAVDFAGRLIYDENENIIVNFGKYKGKEINSVFQKDSSYYDWIQKNDFPLYTKKVFTELYIKFKQNQ